MRKVLIVEDEESVREVIQVTLEAEGYWVMCARNGREALEMVRGESEPCLILLDLLTPVVSGWHFLRLQREDPVLARFPVIVMSATSTQEDAAVSADGLLKKPVQRLELLEAVGRFCTPGDFDDCPPTERWAPQPAAEEDSGPHS